MPDALAPPAARPGPVPSADLKGVVGDPDDRFPDFTAADVPALLESLGALPAGRVRLCPTPGTATAEDAERLRDRTGGLCEAVDGTLVEKAASEWSSGIGHRIGWFLGNWVYPRALGVLLGADGFFHFGPDLRGPDMSFQPNARRRGPLLRRGYSRVAPALVVEVLPPGNTREEMALKRATYFAHDVRRVWELDEDADGPLVRVYDGPDSHVILRTGDALDGAPVLPGFTLPLAELFAEPAFDDAADGDAADGDAADGDAADGEPADGG